MRPNGSLAERFRQGRDVGGYRGLPMIWRLTRRYGSIAASTLSERKYMESPAEPGMPDYLDNPGTTGTTPA
jgi:hypothetical protein